MINMERGSVVEAVYSSDRRVVDTLAEMMLSVHADGHSDVRIQNLIYTHVVNLRPRRVLEVGTHIGSCSLVIGAALRVNGYGKLLTLEPQAHYQTMARENIEKAGLSDGVEIVSHFSYEEACKTRLAAQGPFELIFVDGSHDYDDTLHDIELCAALLHDNGCIILHDTGKDGPGMDSTGKGGARQALYDFTQRRPDMKTIFYEYPMWLDPRGAAIVCKQRLQPAPQSKSLVQRINKALRTRL